MKLGLLFLLISSLAMAQTGTISGRVVDVNGQGILGAAVKIVESDGWAAVLNLDGTFEFSDVPYGSYSLRVVSVGYNLVLVNGIEVPSTNKRSLTVVLEEELLREFAPGFSDSADWFERRRYEDSLRSLGAILFCGTPDPLPDRYGIIRGLLLTDESETVQLETVEIDKKPFVVSTDGKLWTVGNIPPGIHDVALMAKGCRSLQIDSFEVVAGTVSWTPRRFEKK
ncbi:MAG: carboxypeptidase regulatory-like domain-containing protein [Calditrichaeota bacterium]|nr:carboxypeptidase regulatory-like domain-containing protein [Calditrichota bacterium]MCB9391318.1 carboxypeptidase regulatory-like domain-containing protein [Calditrichota bacterium]